MHVEWQEREDARKELIAATNDHSQLKTIESGREPAHPREEKQPCRSVSKYSPANSKGVFEKVISLAFIITSTGWLRRERGPETRRL